MSQQASPKQFHPDQDKSSGYANRREHPKHPSQGLALPFDSKVPRDVKERRNQNYTDSKRWHRVIFPKEMSIRMNRFYDGLASVVAAG